MQHKSHPLLRITYNDIVENCGKTFVTRGRTYLREGMVLDTAWDADSGILTAKVSGNSALPYSQTIKAEESFIDGNCSCPVGYNCKHVAAVLLSWLERNIDKTAPAKKGDNQLAVNNWFNKLERISAHQAVRSDNSVLPGDELLIYELSPASRYDDTDSIQVTILKSRLLKRGGMGKELPYRYQTDLIYPRWMTPIDKEIINLAQAARDRLSYGPVLVEGNLATPLLHKLLASGRCYWQTKREQPLTLGPERRVDLAWKTEDERWRLDAVLANPDTHWPDGWTLVPSPDAWYIDPGLAQAGMISSDLSGEMLQGLLSAPPLNKNQAQETANFFELKLAEASIPPPVQSSFESVRQKPTPVLVLRSLQPDADFPEYFASVHFRYSGHQLPFDGNETSVTEKQNADGRTVLIHRDLSEELNHLVFFNQQSAGFTPADRWNSGQFTSADRMPQPDVPEKMAAVWHQFLERLPLFEAAGWEIQRQESFNLSFDLADSIDAQVEDSAEGWFDLALSITDGGESYPLLPLVKTWLSQGATDMPLMVRAKSGRWLQVPPSMIEPVVQVLLEMYNSTGDINSIQLPRQRASVVNELDANFDENNIHLSWGGDDGIRQLGQDLNNIDKIDLIEPPKGLEAELRDYQLQGVSWLDFLHRYGFNGVLADDMGLGKTLQALAHVMRGVESGWLTDPVLVIAPTSVLGNWKNEAARFTPSLKTLVLHGGERHVHFDDIARYQIVITSYQLMLRDIETIQQKTFGLLILDEAQMIKNPKAKVAQAARSLEIPRRLCLTGTPLENHLGELWSLYDFLMPGFLGNRQQFKRLFRTPIEKHGDHEKQQRLNRMISVFLLRRLKEDVASELPPKTEIVREVELGPRQTQLYESIRLSMEKHVRELISQKGVNRSHIEILDALLKLRQTCCHPQLVNLDNARQVMESTKTDLLIEMVEELISENRKILLFSQFTQMLDLIIARLKQLGLPFVLLTGKTPMKQRQQAIDQFQAGDIPLFLISLKAGGTGLNLTAADTVIHYDPWWNPAVENQASDRAHRIGQTKPVFVYKLVAKNTVEEKIMALQAKKQQLADNTFDQSGTADPFKKLTSDDLLHLFSDVTQ